MLHQNNSVLAHKNKAIPKLSVRKTKQFLQLLDQAHLRFFYEWTLVVAFSLFLIGLMTILVLQHLFRKLSFRFLPQCVGLDLDLRAIPNIKRILYHHNARVFFSKYHVVFTFESMPRTLPLKNLLPGEAKTSLSPWWLKIQPRHKSPRRRLSILQIDNFPVCAVTLASSEIEWELVWQKEKKREKNLDSP